jgi:hypothetical protein
MYEATRKLPLVPDSSAEDCASSTAYSHPPDCDQHMPIVEPDIGADYRYSADEHQRGRAWSRYFIFNDKVGEKCLGERRQPEPATAAEWSSYCQLGGASQCETCGGRRSVSDGNSPKQSL